MKNVFWFATAIISVLIFTNATAQINKTNHQEALQIAGNYLKQRDLRLTNRNCEILTSDNDSLAWVVNCEPKGFIVVSTNPFLPAILAWSSEGDFGDGPAWRQFLPIFMDDLRARNQFVNPESEDALQNFKTRNELMNSAAKNRLYEQWPPEGWSPTGGWLFTNWTQTSPYNDICPVDGQTNVRSVAGCPATAMAQIVNFHHKLNGTRFSDNDDYYHNFGSGNMYWIDNDWEAHGFLSWSDLNIQLDTLESRYSNGIPIKNSDKAALTYACGVAAKQVYSSSVSGTYGISQAYDAYSRFGFSDAQLIYPTNPGLNNMLSQNIKLALPAHLGLVNPEETVGHNVVVDGYCTDELYHFNFGWGGSANGWYTMPPADIPYDLTVIEGVVLNINLSDPPVGIGQNEHEILPYFTCNSTYEYLEVKLPSQSGNVSIGIFDITGRNITNSIYPSDAGNGAVKIDVHGLTNGLYIVRTQMTDGKSYSFKFIR